VSDIPRTGSRGGVEGCARKGKAGIDVEIVDHDGVKAWIGREFVGVETQAGDPQAGDAGQMD
jgi:hypothetical protein